MSPETQAALIGATVGALVGGGFALLGFVLQHYLSLREDKIKRERDRAEEERRNLLFGAREISLNQARGKAFPTTWHLDQDQDIEAWLAQEEE